MLSQSQAFDSAINGPVDIVPITPSNTVSQVPAAYPYFRGLHVVTDGTVSVVTLAGQTRSLPAGYFAAGVDHALFFTRVNATGTTAVLMGLV